MSLYGFRLIVGLTHSGGHLFTSFRGFKEVESVQRTGRRTRRARTIITKERKVFFMSTLLSRLLSDRGRRVS